MRVTLDRYVGRIVAGSWCAALAFFLFLSILIDLLNNLGRYVASSERAGLDTGGLFLLLCRYYAQMVPQFFVSIAPFVTVIACMFAVARLMAANEIVPMLFVGRSIVRILRPVLLCSGIAAAMMAACWQWVVPTSATRISSTQAELTGGKRAIEVVLTTSGADGRQALWVHEYDPQTQVMKNVQFLGEGRLPGDARLVLADEATWDARVGDWRLQNGRVETPMVGRAGTRSEAADWLQQPDLTPDRVWQAGKEIVEVDMMAYDDLLELMRLRPTRTDVRFALHHHIAYPLANVILLLLALPFAVWFERGSRIERVLAAIGVCGAYLMVDLICQSLGQREYIHPIVAAWSPTILFGALGVVLFGSCRT